MYSIGAYGRMLADSERSETFTEALTRAIKPGSTVLDLGAGVGFFALLSCRLGASRVYAVDPDSSLQTARDLAHANGVADRIEFIQAMSTEIELPERVDVVVADLRGVLPWQAGNVESVIDARERFLKPGGALIPACDTLFAAVVDAVPSYDESLAVWRQQPKGVDLELARTQAANAWWRERFADSQLMTEACRGAVLDYRTVTGPDMVSEFQWRAARAGTAQGVAVWFESELADGVLMRSGPGRKDSVYGTAFFPFLEPVSVAAGDAIDFKLRAKDFDGRYVWSWRSEVGVARFSQSTFQGMKLSLEDLQARSAEHVPALKADGRIVSIVLALIDGSRSLGEIADDLRRTLPDEFPSRESALGRVAEIIERFGR